MDQYKEGEGCGGGFEVRETFVGKFHSPAPVVAVEHPEVGTYDHDADGDPEIREMQDEVSAHDVFFARTRWFVHDSWFRRIDAEGDCGQDISPKIYG